MELLRQGQSEAEVASKALSEFKAEEFSPSYGPNRLFAACVDSLRRMIKAGDYAREELDNGLQQCSWPSATAAYATNDSAVPCWDDPDDYFVRNFVRNDLQGFALGLAVLRRKESFASDCEEMNTWFPTIVVPSL